MTNPIISLIIYIDTLPNPNINNILAIADSGANIHLSKQAVLTMDHVVMALQLPGLSKQVRRIHIYPKIKIYSLISLGVLYDDGCTITLDKQ